MSWLIYLPLIAFVSLPVLILLVWPALKLFDLTGWWRLLWLLGPALMLLGLTGFWQVLYLIGLPIMLLAWVADVIVCRTWWPVLFGWPRDNEITVSHSINRIVGEHSEAHPEWLLAACIARVLDRISPGHIPNLTR